MNDRRDDYVYALRYKMHVSTSAIRPENRIMSDIKSKNGIHFSRTFYNYWTSMNEGVAILIKNFFFFVRVLEVKYLERLKICQCERFEAEPFFMTKQQPLHK